MEMYRHVNPVLIESEKKCFPAAVRMFGAASYRLAVGGAFCFFCLSRSDAVIFIHLQMIWPQGSRKLRIHTAAALLLRSKMALVFSGVFWVDILLLQKHKNIATVQDVQVFLSTSPQV